MWSNFSNRILMCFGKRAKVINWAATYYPLAYTAIPTICASHVYIGGSCSSPAILTEVDAEKFSGWFTNNEIGDMLWISIGF